MRFAICSAFTAEFRFVIEISYQQLLGLFRFPSSPP
jgi:hypothetical protein